MLENTSFDDTPCDSEWIYPPLLKHSCSTTGVVLGSIHDLHIDFVTTDK